MTLYYIVQAFLLGMGSYLVLSNQGRNFSRVQIVGMILLCLCGFSIVWDFMSKLFL